MPEASSSTYSTSAHSISPSEVSASCILSAGLSTNHASLKTQSQARVCYQHNRPKSEGVLMCVLSRSAYRPGQKKRAASDVRDSSLASSRSVSLPPASDNAMTKYCPLDITAAPWKNELPFHQSGIQSSNWATTAAGEDQSTGVSHPMNVSRQDFGPHSLADPAVQSLLHTNAEARELYNALMEYRKTNAMLESHIQERQERMDQIERQIKSRQLRNNGGGDRRR